MKNDELKPPKKDIANKIHEYINEVAKTATGGFINPLVDIVLPSLHQKNFEKWCNNVYEKLLELDEKKINNDVEFISLLKETVGIVAKTHQEEKHELLKQALFNHFESNISFDEKIVYVKLIDTLTVSHINVLRLINDNFSEIKWKSKFSYIYDIFEVKKEFYNIRISILKKIFLDLESLGIIEIGNIEYEEKVRQSSLLSFYDDENVNFPYINITNFGEKFIKYILMN